MFNLKVALGMWFPCPEVPLGRPVFLIVALRFYVIKLFDSVLCCLFVVLLSFCVIKKFNCGKYYKKAAKCHCICITDVKKII